MALDVADSWAADWSLDDLLLSRVPVSAPSWQRDILWTALTPRAVAHALQRVYTSTGEQTLSPTFRLEWFSQFTVRDLMDIRGVGFGTVTYTLDALESLARDAGPVTSVADELRLDDLLLRDGAVTTLGWQRDIPWTALTPRVAHALQRLHASTGEQTLTATFRLEWFSQFTLRDLMDVRSVGLVTLAETIGALESLYRDPLSPAEFRVLPRYARLRDSHEPAVLDKDTIKLYGGTDRTVQVAKAKAITDSHALVGYLLANEARKRAGFKLLVQLAETMSNRLEDHRVASLPNLYEHRLFVGASQWGDAVREEFGLTADEVRNAYPRFDTYALVMDLRRRGDTLDAIGQVLGVTRERVRQIIKLVGPMLGQVVSDGVLNARREFKLHETEAIEVARTAKIAAIESAVCAFPGISIEELATNVGLEEDEVRRLTPRLLSKFVLGFERSNTGMARLWTNDQLLDAVKLAGTFFFPLSAPQFNDLVRSGEVDAPTSQTVANRFGTWKNACLAAGIEPTSRGRQYYGPKWSSAEIVAFVAEYLLDPETSGTFADYDRWRLEQVNAVPSGALVRNYLGTWGEAVGLALLKIGECGPLDPSMYCAAHDGSDAK